MCDTNSSSAITGLLSNFQFFLRCSEKRRSHSTSWQSSCVVALSALLWSSWWRAANSEHYHRITSRSLLALSSPLTTSPTYYIYELSWMLINERQGAGFPVFEGKKTKVLEKAKKRWWLPLVWNSTGFPDTNLMSLNQINQLCCFNFS